MKKINMYDLVGNLEQTFDSIADAAKFNGVSVGTIDKAVAGKVFNSKGHIFAYEGEAVLERIRTADKSIMVYDRRGEFIGTFVSITSASKELGVTYDKLRGAQKTGRPVKQEGFFVIGLYDDTDIRTLVDESTSIYKGTLHGEIIEVFHSNNMAAKSVGGCRQGLTKSINTPGHTYKGFLWATSIDRLKKTSDVLRDRVMKSNKKSKLRKSFLRSIK